MARSRETKIELTAYDDLFQTDESREEAKLSKIRDIPISEIDEFPDHPFKVLMDEDMEQLVESIKRNGVMTPATVRLKEDGRYELIKIWATCLIWNLRCLVNGQRLLPSLRSHKQDTENLLISARAKKMAEIH